MIAIKKTQGGIHSDPWPAITASGETKERLKAASTQASGSAPCPKKRPRSCPMRVLTPAFITQAITLILTRHQAEAISANPNPFFEYDENGNRLPPLFIRGDETYHWQEDSLGYTIIDDPNYHGSGNRTRKVYAKMDPKTGHLVSTGVRFGSPDAKTSRAALKKHIKPSAQKQKAKAHPFNEGRNRRNLQEEANRRKLMASTSPLRNLVVLIRFSDHQDRILPSQHDYDILLNGPGGEGTVAPTGSVNDVFLNNSYGTFSLNSTAYPWITVSQTEAYYANGNSGLGPRIFEAIREALDILDSDPDIDLSEFNTDFDEGDHFIDAVTVIHSGFGAEFGGSDCYGASESMRVWSHSWLMYTGAWTSQDGSVTVSKYHINSGLWGVCGSTISRIGVIAHETAHFLGLPDLYDPDGGSGIGTYCLMSDS